MRQYLLRAPLTILLVAAVACTTDDAETGGSGEAGAATGAKPGTCRYPADVDGDCDGVTIEQGDCNDRDPNVNPGAIEVVITEPGEDGVISGAGGRRLRWCRRQPTRSRV